MNSSNRSPIATESRGSRREGSGAAHSGAERPPSGPMEPLDGLPEPGEHLLRELVRAQGRGERGLPAEAGTDRERAAPRPGVVVGRDERARAGSRAARPPRGSARTGTRRARGRAGGAAVRAAGRTPGRPRGSSPRRRRRRPTGRPATSRRGRHGPGHAGASGGGRRYGPPARAGTRGRDAGGGRARRRGYRPPERAGQAGVAGSSGAAGGAGGRGRRPRAAAARPRPPGAVVSDRGRCLGGGRPACGGRLGGVAGLGRHGVDRHGTTPGRARTRRRPAGTGGRPASRARRTSAPRSRR